MQKQPSKLSAGFTFIELAIGMSVGALLFVVFLRFMAVGYPLSKTIFEQSTSNETARVQLSRIVQALREVAYSNTGDYPLEETSAQKIVFYADVTNDGIPERIRYELQGTELLRGVTEFNQDEHLYIPEDEQETTIATSIQNGEQPLFTYYGSEGEEESPPARVDVRSVKVHLVIDKDINKDPAPIDLESQVFLRNVR